eukprot:gene493-1139_t
MAASAHNGRSAKQCAIAVEKKDDFCASPPFCWHLDPETGKMKCNDNSFIVMVRDSRFEGRDVTIEVSDAEEVLAVRKLLARKRIVTTAHCHTNLVQPGSSSASDSNLFLKTVDFVVIINTSHPLISSQLDAAFNRAEEFIKDGKMFRIKIAFSDSLRQYMDNVNSQEDTVTETLVWNCDIFITHGLSTPTCADHFFACKNSGQTALWFLCFPCCLVTGFPYILYKRCFGGIKEETIRYTVPVTYHDGPFMTGFDLHSLLLQPRKLSVNSQHSIKSCPDTSSVNKFVPGSPPPLGKRQRNSSKTHLPGIVINASR